jgi:hypothetical protein
MIYVIHVLRKVYEKSRHKMSCMRDSMNTEHG